MVTMSHITNAKQFGNKLLLASHSGDSYRSVQTSYCGYIGPSMHPTLRQQDLLEITPYQNKKTKVGDVILFSAPGLTRPVVHRVIQKKGDKFRTRGDNCSLIDPWQIEQKDIIGRVTSRVRGNKDRNIAGGWLGRLQARRCRAYIFLIPKLSNCLQTTFKILHTHTFVSTVNSPKIRPVAIRFENIGTPSHKLMLGTRHIGQYDSTASKWQLKFPYRFLFNQASLPKV